jgi:hypothetical protein
MLLDGWVWRGINYAKWRSLTGNAGQHAQLRRHSDRFAALFSMNVSLHATARRLPFPEHDSFYGFRMFRM